MDEIEQILVGENIQKNMSLLDLQELQLKRYTNADLKNCQYLRLHMKTIC